MPSEGNVFRVVHLADVRRSPVVVDSSTAHQRVTRRLGREELGPHAYETRMPRWLLNHLHDVQIRPVTLSYPEQAAVVIPTFHNETPNLISTFEALSKADPHIQRSYFCHPSVNHVGKLPLEGSFCGYRNIQMLLSYLRGCDAAPKRTFYASKPHKPLPSIFQIQEGIEQAWAAGFQANARLELGTLRCTRKYIGSAEADALFQLLHIPCHIETFTTVGGLHASDAMLARLKQYFEGARRDLVRPPIFLQRHGHSMTIVGYEETDKTCHLLAFNQQFQVPKALAKASKHGGGDRVFWGCAMESFRYRRQYLSQWDRYELVFLDV